MARLEAVATAVPDHVLEQDTVVEVARAYLEEHAPDLLDVLPVFQNAGVGTRYLARELAWYLEPRGWGARAEAFRDVGLELTENVTRQLLREADVPLSAIDGIVLVTTTGLSTPSLEARLASRMAMRRDVVRVPVWGLGCAGGVAGLARTAELVDAHRDKRFLFLSLELCSLAFLSADMSKKNVVAVAIFGDGCAGALVSGDELDATGPALERASSHLWPASEEVMGWDVRDEGLGVVFSRAIPRIVEDEFAPRLHEHLKPDGLDIDDVRLLFHPGGKRVLEAYERALGVSADRLDESRDVLDRYGNMSSPTALFVLAESLARGPLDEGETGTMAALGPGFAAEFLNVVGAP